MKKKPDLLALLVVVIGAGVLFTELASGFFGSEQRPEQTQTSYYRQ